MCCIRFTLIMRCAADVLTFLIPNSPLFCRCHGCWQPFASSIKLDFKAVLTVIVQAAMRAYISSVSDSWLYKQEFQGGNERSECIHLWDGSRIHDSETSELDRKRLSRWAGLDILLRRWRTWNWYCHLVAVIWFAASNKIPQKPFWKYEWLESVNSCIMQLPSICTVQLIAKWNNFSWFCFA